MLELSRQQKLKNNYIFKKLIDNLKYNIPNYLLHLYYIPGHFSFFYLIKENIYYIYNIL